MDALFDLSSRIGRNPLLSQASSGNTSLKASGTLWIKASGKWLAAADQEEIFVPVQLSTCLECLGRGDPLPAHNGDSQAPYLRPSIETFMHAILPQRVVVHVHSINTIAWAVRLDAPVRLSERLSGLRWQWVPYVSSGLPLAREIQVALSRCPGADVFVLGNHGLVVCGEDCGSAESLLFEVEQRLATSPRTAPKPRLGLLELVQRMSKWRLPEGEVPHTLGTDLASRRIAKGGVLYPCQAVFLGRSLPLLPCSKPLTEVRSPMYGAGESSRVLIIEGSGVLISEQMTTAERATFNGFVEVVRRIEASAPIRYMTGHEVSDLLGADGHYYKASAENGVPRSAVQS
ncbi:MAG: class II aldolase [Acidobacteriaceae bacterium]|nr:class II aldolase [Acidobacteriaceae bacterium]